MKKITLTLASGAYLICSVNAQVINDELHWIPEGDTAMNGSTITAPGAVYTITDNNSGTGTIYTHNETSWGDSIDIENGGGSLTFTFKEPLTFFAIDFFGLSPEDAVSFNVAASSASPDTIAVLAADKLSVAPHSSVTGDELERFTLEWDNLPSNTKSITINTTMTQPGSSVWGRDLLGLTRLSYETSPVPEPSSTALLGLGALGLILRRKK